MKKTGNSISNITFVGLNPEYTNQVASLVAEQLEMYFLDTLALFEFDISPVTLTEYLQMHGIGYYRDEEKGFVKYVCTFNNTVLTFQSGVLVSPTKMNCITKNGLVIYIHQEMNRIRKYQQAKNYQSPELKKLFFLKDSEISKRSDRAKKYSDIMVNGSKIGVFKCSSEVIRQIKKYYGLQEV